jgi:adenylate kinase
MNFIFLGPPGAGKGTLAAKVAEMHNIPHISTGVIFRAAIKSKTALGLRVQSIIDAGELVSDEITIELVKERLTQNDAKKGFILDGFPRTIPQAEALAKIILIDHVVNFNIEDADVIARLSGRRVCKNCGHNFHKDFMPPKKEGICDNCGSELFIRDDDKEDAITHRLEVYRDQTEPLIAYYKKEKLITSIDARPSTETILKDFENTFYGK